MFMSASYASFRLALNNTPFCQAVYTRMRHPKIGEMVMEISRAAYKQDPRGFGLLVTHCRSEAESEIKNLNGKTIRWTNANVVAIPTMEMILEVDKKRHIQ